MAYSIFLRPATVRDLRGLPDQTKERIETAIDQL